MKNNITVEEKRKKNRNFTATFLIMVKRLMKGYLFILLGIKKFKTSHNPTKNIRISDILDNRFIKIILTNVID